MDIAKLKEVKDRLDAASSHMVCPKPFYVCNVTEQAKSFKDWFTNLSKQTDSNDIRNWLYFGFQPLYDRLVEDVLPNSVRPIVVRLLDDLIQINTEFVRNYYLAQEQHFWDGALQKLQDIQTLEIPYRTKFRNVDYNIINVRRIHGFLTSITDFFIEEDLPIPDHVVGCACGASEIAMALASLMETKPLFIRSSKRRGDELSKILSEHHAEFVDKFKDSTVLCVEDILCTGKSLKMTMKKVVKYHPKMVYGVSLHDGEEGDECVRLSIGDDNCHVFALPGVKCTLTT
jgi:hypoxanthine-guanine phosphoribosyltransferase